MLSIIPKKKIKSKKRKRKIGKIIMNKLCEYLDFRGIKYHVFAKKIGTSTTTLHQILKKGRDPSRKLAVEIEKKTQGFVTVYDWDLPTENVKDKKEQNNETQGNDQK
jgi:DNA-binding XRE family transcriptional regulator